MKSRQFDFAIVGDSLSAASAAHRLAMSQLRGVWLADGGDSGGIESLVDTRTIGPSEHARGNGYRTRVQEAIGSAIEIAGVVEGVDRLADSLVIETSRGERLVVRSAVAAPFGSERDLPRDLAAERYLGRGMYKDARTGADRHRGEPVVVLGSGERAAEQALIAAGYADLVTIVSPSSPNFGVFANRVHEIRTIVVEPRCKLMGLDGDARERLTSVRVRRSRGGETWHIAANALFLAQKLEFRAACYRGRRSFESMVGSGRLFPAGLANGVAHGDRNAAFSSGRQAAIRLHRSLSTASCESCRVGQFSRPA